MRSPLPQFVALYALLYSAFGVASPFLPVLIEARGVPSTLIGVLFGAGTAIRLLSAPVAARFADRMQAVRATLAFCAVASAVAALAYLPTTPLPLLVAIVLLHSAALAPTTNLADALALDASETKGFEYGWVRGAGSTAFIAGSIVSGWAIAKSGIGIIALLQASLMVTVPLAVMRVPPLPGRQSAIEIKRADIWALLGNRTFRRIVLLAALVLGSHAMHDTFSVIRWTRAGIAPQVVSWLWSLAVAAEVVVFFVLGPWLLHRLSPARAAAIAACAGAVRWLVAASTTNLLALCLIQPLHGLTFALLHLACMRLLARSVPSELAATAQAVYGTVGIGAATALLTVISGWLYAGLGAAAFALMSVLCLAALPLTRILRNDESDERSAGEPIRRPEGLA